MRKRWSKSEIDFLKDNYPTNKTELVAKKLGRSLKSVYVIANVLKIKKTSEFLKTEASGRFNSRSNNILTQFKKGQQPWNKGLKGINIGGEETQFKKGSEPHNTLSDGTISKRIDKRGKEYYWIRISKSKWIPYHVYLWIQEYGNIPKNNIVRFKDNNSLNCVLENLELITRKENMIKNTIHRYPQEIKEAIRAVKKLNKTINKINDEK